MTKQDALIPEQITVRDDEGYLVTVINRKPVAGERGLFILDDVPFDLSPEVVFDMGLTDADKYGWEADGNESAYTGTYLITVITEPEPEDLNIRFAYRAGKLQQHAEHMLKFAQTEPEWPTWKCKDIIGVETTPLMPVWKRSVLSAVLVERVKEACSEILRIFPDWGVRRFLSIAPKNIQNSERASGFLNGVSEALGFETTDEMLDAFVGKDPELAVLVNPVTSLCGAGTS